MAVIKQTTIYKQTDQGALRIDHYAARPPLAPSDAAALLLPGGGWMQMDVNALARQCEYLAMRGMQAFCAEYRGISSHGVTAIDAMEDGFDALRWVRSKAGSLGFRPDRILMGGGSAGGGTSLAAAVQSVRRGQAELMPDAIVGFNPPGQFTQPDGRSTKFAGHAADYCPTANARAIRPPVLIFHGEADTTVPLEDVLGLRSAVCRDGGRCEVVAYPAMEHGFFHADRHGGVPYVDTMSRLDRWLTEMGWLSPWSAGASAARPRQPG